MAELLGSCNICFNDPQLYFLGSIDVAKFYVRVSFSFFDRTFETKLPLAIARGRENWNSEEKNEDSSK